MTQVFISYKSEYVEFARSLREKLIEWGYQTWFDKEDIPKGSYFRLEIQKGLQNSHIICGVMTQEAFNSREVMAEWDYFLKRNKPLLPLKYAECEPLYHIEHIQYIDFTKDVAEGFGQLQKALPPPSKSDEIQPRREAAAPLDHVPQPVPEKILTDDAISVDKSRTAITTPLTESPVTPGDKALESIPAKPMSPIDKVNRSRMLQKVSSYWIKGVLER